MSLKPAGIARKSRPVQEFTISEALWERLAALLPVHTAKAQPLGCHRPRADNRRVLNGIFFVLRTGCQWKALDATGIGSGSTAHARFPRVAGRRLFRAGVGGGTPRV